MSRPLLEESYAGRFAGMIDCPIHSPHRAEEQEALWFETVKRLRDRPFKAHWDAFQRIYANRRKEDGPPIVWKPDEETKRRANVGWLMRKRGMDSYAELHAWSAKNRADFWETVIRRLGVVFSSPPETMLDLTNGVRDPRWLKGAVYNIADSCFKAEADRPAIVSGGETYDGLRVVTYGELERLANRFANGLREHGVEPDEAVALYMPMTVECVAAYLGIIRAGCRAVSIADSFSPSEVKTRMEIGGAHLILTVDGYIRAGRAIDMYDKVRQAGAPRAIVISNASSGSTGALRDSDTGWEDFLSPNDAFESVAGDPYRVTNVLFSSGTTGAPKAIPWTHLTPIKCGMDGHFHQDIHPEDVVAWPTNIGWMMGPWLIYATLLNNATMALYEGAPTEEGFTRFIQNAGVTVLGVVPSLVRAWRTVDALEKVDWTRIRLFSSTGEPSNREDYLWLMSRTGYRAPVIEYLGGTEIGGGHLAGTVVQPASPAAFTTPALGIDFVILDDHDNPVEEGETGELYLIPPSIGMSQTLLNRDHEEEYYRGCPAGPRGETLRRHGDAIARLHRGFFRAQGRSDDTMNLGGIKVSSLELERVIDTQEGVYESAAVAVQPEGEGAEKLVVFAVTARETDRETLHKALQSLINRQLNPLFKIYDLVLTESLPRTASNKLMRRVLRTEYKPGLQPREDKG